jgi:hypothetical protein
VDPPPPLAIGKPVLFEVVLWQPPPPGWSLQYRFDFGDGTQTDWISERQATHTYLSPGSGRYPVHVDIASTNRGQLISTKVIDQNVDVVPISNPIPSATSPTAITPSPTASYTTTATSEPTATPSKTSTATPSATVTPSPTSTYTPINTAAPTATSVVGPPTPSSVQPWKMLWLYIAAGIFGVAALAYLGYAKSKLNVAIAARPAFYAHSDWNAPQNPPRNVAIKYELRFDSNLSAGQDRIEIHGASLIQQRKKQ